MLTAFYLMRAYCLTFMGASRENQGMFHTIKEAPFVMIIPVSILALLSIIGGFLGSCFDCIPILENFLDDINLLPEERVLTTHFRFTPGMLLSVLSGAFGIGLAAWIYIKSGDRYLNVLPLLKKSFYVDEIYETLFVAPIRGISKFVKYFFEPYVINGILQGFIEITQGISRLLRLIQSGQIRSYVAWMVIGAVLLTTYFVY